MGVMSAYLKWREDVVPDGIRKPKIAHEYGMVERKPVPSSAYGGGKVYAYRLNQSHYRFKGVEW